jgi:hypothetical protein
MSRIHGQRLLIRHFSQIMHHQPELKNHKKDIYTPEKKEKKWRRNPFQPKVIIIIFAFNFDAISFILEPNWKKLDRCLRT